LIRGSPEICEFTLNTQRFVIFGAKDWIQNCEGSENLVASWQKETQPSFQKKDLGAVARKKRQSVVFKNHVTEKYTTA
jgi:hypothetical protein